jgi:hypothetical protein
MATSRSSSIPTVIAAPAIQGSPTYSSTLTISGNTWYAYPATTMSYQWYLCDEEIVSSSVTLSSGCSAVSGATQNQLIVSSGALGKYSIIGVTNTNAQGTSTIFSASTSQLRAAPQYTSAGYINELRTTGVTLSFTEGVLVNYPTLTSKTYQWYRCGVSVGNQVTVLPDGCTSIDGATEANYVLQADDEGFYVSPAITATNAVGRSTTWLPNQDMTYGRTTITQSQSFSVPEGIYSVEVLVVAGGGAGAGPRTYANGGAGGGGQVLTSTLAVTPGQTITAVIGSSNQNTVFGTITALKGNNGSVAGGMNWGGGGGSGYSGANLVSGSSGSQCAGCNGGDGGGVATSSNISGQPTLYGGGGFGYAKTNGTGLYGFGGASGSANGVPGGSGVVIIRWRHQ